MVCKEKKTSNSILTEDYIRELHIKMLGETWKWAGEFRKTEKNIGVDSITIGIALRQLLDDAKYWIENVVYSQDEIAIRFKHRLVQIHCFTNGNGRHSRLMADVIITQLFNGKHFSWGQSNLSKGNIERNEYLKALKKADRNDFDALIQFSRS